LKKLLWAVIFEKIENIFGWTAVVFDKASLPYKQTHIS